MRVWTPTLGKYFDEGSDSFVGKVALSRKRTYAVIAVTAVGVSALLLFVYTSPAISWDSSIRDIDGDGVSDSDDAYPDDPTIWGRASATAVITIVNNCGIDVWYFLVGIDGTGYIGMMFDEIGYKESEVQNLVYRWDVGLDPAPEGVARLRTYSNATLVAEFEERFDLIADETIPVSMWIGSLD